MKRYPRLAIVHTFWSKPCLSSFHVSLPFSSPACCQASLDRRPTSLLQSALLLYHLRALLPRSLFQLDASSCTTRSCMKAKTQGQTTESPPSGGDNISWLSHLCPPHSSVFPCLSLFLFPQHSRHSCAFVHACVPGCMNGTFCFSFSDNFSRVTPYRIQGPFLRFSDLTLYSSCAGNHCSSCTCG